MTYWQFLACADGYALAHGAKPAIEPVSDEVFLAWADTVRPRAGGKPNGSD